MDKIQILADSYPLEDMLIQNDIETRVVVQWLVDEELIDLDDYFGFEDMPDDVLEDELNE